MSIILVALTAVMCNGPLGNLENPEKDCTAAQVALVASHPMCNDVRDVYLAYQKKTPQKHGYLSCSIVDGDGSDLTIVPFDYQSDSLSTAPEAPAVKSKATVEGLRT